MNKENKIKYADLLKSYSQLIELDAHKIIPSEKSHKIHYINSRMKGLINYHNSFVDDNVSETYINAYISDTLNSINNIFISISLKL